MSICRDITDRKQTEEALRKSEELFRKVFEDHAAVKLIIDPDTGKIIDANKAAVVFYGWSREQLKQMRIQDINTLSPEEVKEEMEKVRADKRIHFEFRHRRADGSVRDVDVFSSKIEVNKRDLLHSIIYDITERKQAEEKLRESEERQRLERDRLELILKTAQDGFWLVDASTGHLVDVNEAASSMLGYTREELLKRGLTDIDAQWSPEEIASEMEKVKTAGNMLFETRHRVKGGQIIDVEVSVNYLPATDQIFSFIRNITDRRRLEEALKKREAMLNEMGTIARVGGWEFDTESQKQVWTKEVYNIHEVDESYEPTVSKGIEFYVPESRLVIERAVQRAIEYGEPFDVELEIITAKGNHRWVHANGNVLQEKGITKIVSGIFQDITERRQAEEKIRQMAYHDSLTGLPNRKLFSDRLDIALAHAQRNQNKIGIAMLDLDNFKDVNDTLGHDVGDLLLKATAERLKASLRKSDTVARFGGDEFVLILPDLEVVEGVIKVAQKIVDSFRKPFLIDTHKLVVTTSIGIAGYPDDGTDEGTLLKNADIAMYQAKQAGRDRYQLCKKT